MISKRLQAQIDHALAPMLSVGEQPQRNCLAWKAERAGHIPVFLMARERVVVVLTNQRLIVLARKKNDRHAGVSWQWAAKFEDITLIHKFWLSPVLNIALATSSHEFSLDFPPGTRKLGRLFLRQLNKATELPVANQWSEELSQ